MRLLTYPDDRLRKVCRSDFTVSLEIVPAMFRRMTEWGGIGLAAPQVGIDARLFITGWGEVFVNPTYTGEGPLIVMPEQCLSVPGEIGRRYRYLKIVMGDGRVYTREKALVIQHEIDHLNGILCTDPLDKP